MCKNAVGFSPSSTRTPALPFCHFRLSARKPVDSNGDPLRGTPPLGGDSPGRHAGGQSITQRHPACTPSADGRRPVRTWGDHLRRHRMQQGVSRRELARLLGTSLRSVERWETNKTVPALRWLPAIIAFLGSGQLEEFPIPDAYEAMTWVQPHVARLLAEGDRIVSVVGNPR